MREEISLPPGKDNPHSWNFVLIVRTQGAAKPSLVARAVVASLFSFVFELGEWTLVCNWRITRRRDEGNCEKGTVNRFVEFVRFSLKIRPSRLISLLQWFLTFF